jgi:hypothetical protein
MKPNQLLYKYDDKDNERVEKELKNMKTNKS